MTERNDGGPAFPFGERKYDGGNHYLGTQFDPGMTLRDWFAGQALASMLSQPSQIGESTYSKAADLSYRFADAMLEARK